MPSPLHREKEYALLSSLLDHVLPSTILLQGAKQVGKKYTLQQVLLDLSEEQDQQLVVAHVSCRPLLVASSITSFLSDIADALELCSDEDDEHDDEMVLSEGSNLKMSNVDDLALALRHKYHRSSCQRQLHPKVVLEVRHVDELLRSGKHGSLLCSLSRLQERTKLNLCLILVSSNVLNSMFNLHEFIPITFEAYNRNELIDLLAIAMEEHEQKYETSLELTLSQELYHSYAQAIIGLYMTTTKSLPRLLSIALHLKPLFIAPLIQDECEASASQFLCKRLYNELKDRTLDELMSCKTLKSDCGSMEVIPDDSVKMSRMHVELPYFSKLLLIAAFLASYNPPRTDTKMFLKNSKTLGKKHNKKTVKANKKTASSQRGPKAFPMERLMAIFYAVQEGAVHPSLQIQCQLATLLKLGFLTQQGVSTLEVPQFKANVGYEFVLHMSKQVDVDLQAFLYEDTM